MKISFESKGDFDVVTRWLKDITTRKPTNNLNKIASEGTQSLSANTPKNTGETAAGWVSEITSKGNTHEIAWKNTAHPELNVNLAKLIETGHGTKNGGYVPPNPYIKRSMDSILNTAGDKIARELIK